MRYITPSIVVNRFIPVLLTTVASCLFSGCIPNPDTSETLSGGYLYRDEGADLKEILGRGNTGIFSKVVGSNHNRDFIVVEQQPNYEEHKSTIACNLRMNTKRYPTNSVEEIRRSEMEADSILKHDPYYLAVFGHPTNYWIIDNKHDKVYGPLQKIDYENMRRQLHVPQWLSIRLQ